MNQERTREDMIKLMSTMPNTLVKYDKVVYKLSIRLDELKLSAFDLSFMLSLVFPFSKEKILDDILNIRRCSKWTL